MENKINWNDWLKRRTLLEIEMALLTLGLNPDNFDIDNFDGHYLRYRDLLQDLEKTFDRRMDFIRDYRFTPYEYMSNDGVGGNCYSNNEGTLKVKSFLLWLKNEDMGWDLPPELKTFIDLMDKSKNPNNIETNHRRLNPKEWHPICDLYAQDQMMINNKISLTQLSQIILNKFMNEGIVSVRGNPFGLDTISRHLSDWGFNEKRSQMLNSKK
jgi:hypothetical protein